VEGEVANRLQEEHVKLLEAGADLKEMVEMILMDAVIPLDQFTSRLEQFVALQEAHMNYEEGVIFPHLRDSLTEDDWRQLEQNWQNRAIGDPLFGAEVSQHFQALAKRLSLPLTTD
ncbi:MAG: hemerythrin domain-containing protein, partial [Aeromonas sobria]